MGSPTGFLTLNSSEWPKDVAVCSLSDTLETGDVPRRFFLSPKACQGILRRAERRGKELPKSLQRALEAVVTAASPVAAESTLSPEHSLAELLQVVDSGQTSTLPEDCKPSPEPLTAESLAEELETLSGTPTT